MAERGSIYLAVNNCLEADEIAGDWKPKFDGTSIKLLSCAIEREPIPMQENSVNCIYFGATLEHIQNSPRPIFAEFKRILKPGGLLIVDVPNFVCLRHRVLMLMGVNILPSIDYIYNCDFHAEHHREYKLQEVIKVFEWSGFDVTEACYDDIITHRSMLKRGKLAHARDAANGYYTSGTVWDYNQPFRILNWFDWLKVSVRPLLTIFPSLKDDIFVTGIKP
jgi:SAM-dependent methyltransferase